MRIYLCVDKVPSPSLYSATKLPLAGYVVVMDPGLSPVWQILANQRADDYGGTTEGHGEAEKGRADYSPFLGGCLFAGDCLGGYLIDMGI